MFLGRILKGGLNKVLTFVGLSDLAVTGVQLIPPAPPTPTKKLLPAVTVLLLIYWVYKK